MAYFGQIIDVFVSSPGDVSEHRNAIMSIVQAWNQRNGRTRNLFFNCLRWEDLIAPDIGNEGQNVINEQLGDDYDIFLGVMWARFGTQTHSAQSGTEEEFDRAVQRNKTGEAVRVSFLFCTSDVPLATLDGEQYAKVQSFKKKAQEIGCLTRDFIDDASLINAVNLILDRFANTWAGQNGSKQISTDLLLSEGSSMAESNQSPENESEDDLGILDVLEEFSTQNSAFVKSLGTWADRLTAVADETQNTTLKLTDISKFGNPEPQQVREVIQGLTSEMESFGDWCDEEFIHLERVMEKISRGSLLIVDLSRDFNESTDDVIEARDAMAGLSTSILGANEGILDFASNLERAPRLDKKLNRASKKVIDVHRRLAARNRLLQEDIILCVDDLNERLTVGQN